MNSQVVWAFFPCLFDCVRAEGVQGLFFFWPVGGQGFLCVKIRARKKVTAILSKKTLKIFTFSARN